jgi:hypothetical protein
VLFDENGVIEADVIADGSSVQGKSELLVLNATEVLAVYTRPAFEEPHAGASRVFARVLTIAPRAPRRRSVTFLTAWKRPSSELAHTG